MGSGRLPLLGTIRLRNTSAEILEQDLEVVFFVGLCSVVSRPVLAVGSLYLFSYPNTTGDFTSVFGLLSLNGKFGCPDVLTLYPTAVEVGASASGCTVETNGVMTTPGLRWDDPFPFFFGDLGVINDTDGSELSLIHGVSPSLTSNTTGSTMKMDGLCWHPRCQSGYGLVECYQHSAGPIHGLAAGRGFEPLSPKGLSDYKSGPIGHYGTPPSYSFPLNPSLKRNVVIRDPCRFIPLIVGFPIFLGERDLALNFKPF